MELEVRSNEYVSLLAYRPTDGSTSACESSAVDVGGDTYQVLTVVTNSSRLQTDPSVDCYVVPSTTVVSTGISTMCDVCYFLFAFLHIMSLMEKGIFHKRKYFFPLE